MYPSKYYYFPLIPEQIQFNPSLTVGDASFSLWFHGDGNAVGTVSHRPLVVLAGSTQRLAVLLHSTNGFLSLYVHDDTITEYQVVSGDTEIAYDKWVHLAVTWSSADGEYNKHMHMVPYKMLIYIICKCLLKQQH